MRLWAILLDLTCSRGINGLKLLYSRCIVGKCRLRPGTRHRFLLEDLPHVLGRKNKWRPWMVMGRGRRWCNARTIQLSSPVSFELDGTATTSGCTGSTAGTQTQPWWPPSTHDSGAGQETAPLVGTRGEAVRTLLRQQASSFLPLLPPANRIPRVVSHYYFTATNLNELAHTP